MIRRHAFTLIEMLVVIAIIALLISIVQPSLSKARYRAQVVKCQVGMNSMWLAQTALADANQGYFWRHDDYCPDYLRSGGAPGSLWDAMKRGRYLSDHSVTICPVIKAYPGPSIAYSGSYLTYIDADWNGSDYAGFGTQQPQILTVYLWFANYRHGYGTAVSGAQTVYLDVNGQVEKQWPRNMSEATSDRAFMAHRISGGPTSTAHHDLGHLGDGLALPSGADLLRRNEEQPVGFSDGHVTIRPRSEIKERAQIPIGNIGYLYY